MKICCGTPCILYPHEKTQPSYTKYNFYTTPRKTRFKKNERMPDKRKKCWLDYMFLFYHYWIVISPNVIWIDLGSISFWKLTRIWNRKKKSLKKIIVLVCSLCKYEYITGNIYQHLFETLLCLHWLWPKPEISFLFENWTRTL